MKETRKCIICKTGEFTAKTTSKRKTCCNACSRQHIKNIQLEYHQRPDVIIRKKEYKKMYCQRQREKKSLELIE